MPSINLARELYDKIVLLRKDPAKFANEATKEKLEKEAK
jgi:hypothetical protein